MTPAPSTGSPALSEHEYASAVNKRKLFADLGYEPHPAQWQIHESRRRHRVAACGTRFGKTVAASWEGVVAMLEPKPQGSMGWVVAPTYDLADKVYREIEVTVGTRLPEHVLRIREKDKMIRIRNLGGGVSELRMKSADKPVSLLGEGLDWLVIDEGSRLPARVWESYLSQRLIDKQGWSLEISTPAGLGGFYDRWKLGQGEDPSWESWNFPSWSNPFLRRELIESQRTRIPLRAFRQEYEAQFLEGEGSVFSKAGACATGTFEEWEPGYEYVAGLDLARISDFTVLFIVRRAGMIPDPDADPTLPADQSQKMGRAKVVAAVRLHKLDWPVLVEVIAAKLKEYRDPAVIVDATGIGEPLIMSLADAGCEARPFVITGANKGPLMNNLALLLERAKVEIPRRDAFPWLLGELEQYEYVTTDAGNVKMGAPERKHDDCVVALALACWPLRVDLAGEGCVLA